MSDDLQSNIFRFATSELSHSAFWAWIVESLAAPDREDLREPRAVATRLLEKIGAPLPESRIEVTTEKSLESGGRLDIQAEVDSESLIAIENKTSAHPDIDQLRGYSKALRKKAAEPYCAIISTAFDCHVRPEIEEGLEEWTYLGIDELAEVLQAAEGDHPLVSDYSEWLKSKEKRREKVKQALENDEWELPLSGPLGQWILMSKITKELDGTQYRGGNVKGSGSPWTQFRFVHPKEDPSPDKIFYRIDEVKKGYYFSVRQYKRHGVDKAAKEARLQDLRAKWKQALDSHGSDLNPEEPDDRGTYESKVAVFYFKDNPPSKLISEIPAVHDAFIGKLREAGIAAG